MKNRNVIMCVLLCFFTCGIYQIYWMYQLISAVPKITGQPSLISNPLLETICCLTPYQWIWLYKTGEALDNSGGSVLSSSNNGFLFIVLWFVGLGLIPYCVIQTEINNQT